MTITAYPLTWPQAFPRTKTREAGKFKATLAGAHLGTMAKHATRFSGSQRVAIAKSNRGEE